MKPSRLTRLMIPAALAVLLWVGLTSAAAGGPEPCPGDVEKYTKIRMDYAAADGFNPAWRTDKKRVEVIAAFKANDQERALLEAENWLAGCPVDAEIHELAAYLYRKFNQPAKSFAHLQQYYGLLASIASTGNGLTPETAMKVISVHEEYSILRELRLNMVEQSLIDGPMDKMVCDADGREVIMYFDVSIPMAAYSKILKLPETSNP